LIFSGAYFNLEGMEKKKYVPKVRELLATYYDTNANKRLDKGEFLIFDLDQSLNSLVARFQEPHLEHTEITIYNPAKPITHQDKKYLIGRVEPIFSENSSLMFFEEKEGIWRLVDEAPVLGLQDPFYVHQVDGWNLIGGVRLIAEKDMIKYETVFHRYHQSVMELFDLEGKVREPFARGPLGMKDIRLIQISEGRIAIFTRPQGGMAGLGKIGYVEISKLDDLEQGITRAELIPNQFHDDEWGGVNDLLLLKNGKIGVLGHIAHMDGNVKHYYAMSFVFDPQNRMASHMEILTTADEFPPVRPKKSDLGKIIFSGGIHRNTDGTADLYVGIGDVKAGRIRIQDPFLKHEE
jgi:hypothetical protein